METATITKTAPKNLRHLLEEQARDLYNAESRYSEFLGKIKLSTNDNDLTEKFEAVKAATLKNVETIKDLCGQLNVPPTGVKCEAMAGLLREANETNEEYVHGSLKDAALIANAQRIAHYEIAGFGTAKAFAAKLNMNNIADAFEEMADKSGDIDKAFTKIATGSWLTTGVNDDAI